MSCDYDKYIISSHTFHISHRPFVHLHIQDLFQSRYKSNSHSLKMKLWISYSALALAYLGKQADARPSPPAPRRTRRPTRRPTPRPTPRPTAPTPQPTPRPTRRPYARVPCKRTEKVYNESCKRWKSFLGFSWNDDCCANWVCDEKTLRCREKVCGKEGETCRKENGLDGCCEDGLICNEMLLWNKCEKPPTAPTRCFDHGEKCDADNGIENGGCCKWLGLSCVAHGQESNTCEPTPTTCQVKEEPCTETCKESMFFGLICKSNCCSGFVCDKEQKICREQVCGKAGDTCDVDNGINDGCCEPKLDCKLSGKTCKPEHSDSCEGKGGSCFAGSDGTDNCCMGLKCDRGDASDIWAEGKCIEPVCFKEGDECHGSQAMNDGCGGTGGCESGLSCEWFSREMPWVCKKDSVITEEDKSEKSIAKECHDKVYEVTVHALEGPHFAIAATLPNDTKSTGMNHCPSAVGFYSKDGEKHHYVAYDGHEEYDSVDEIKLGSAKLADFFKAEEDATPIDESTYDFTSNSCVHYAGDIWRRLKVDETKELAEFIINNVVNDDSLKVLLKEREDIGSFRTTAMLAIGGKPAMRSFISDIVYEQLHIIDEDDQAMIA